MHHLGHRGGARRWRRVVGAALSVITLAAGVAVTSAPALAGKRLRVAQGDDLEAKMAEARLAGGRPLLAADMARKCLDHRPDADACERVLLRSLAAAGRCDDALPGIQARRSAYDWDAELALAEGMCLLRRGDPHTAREAFAEAISFKEKDPLYGLEYGLTSIRLGDLDEAMAAKELILQYSDADWMADALDLWAAAWRGDPDLDFLVQQGLAAGISRGRPYAVQVALIDCERWLDLGDPVQADDAARRGIKFTNQATRLLACRAEAVRRQGWIDEAWDLVSRPWNEIADTPALDAVKARILVDRGDFAEAARLLSGLAEDPEAVAARWYLARARGDTAAADALRRRWTSGPRPVLRQLDAYLPIPPG